MDYASGRVFLIVFGVEELDFNISEYEGRTCAFDKYRRYCGSFALFVFIKYSNTRNFFDRFLKQTSI